MITSVRALFSRRLRISPTTTPRSDVDIPQLDTKTVEEYVQFLKSLRDNGANAPWDFCHTLAEHLQWSRVLLSLLSDVSLEPESSLKISKCIDVACTILKADSVQLFEIDGIGNSIKLKTVKLHDSVQNSSAVKLLGFKYSKGNTIEDEVIRNNVVVNIKDAQSDSRYSSELDKQLGITSKLILCAPVPDKCGVLKVVRCGSKESPLDPNEMFSKNDEILVEFLAKILSTVMKESLHERIISNQGVKINSLDNLFSYGVLDFEFNDIIQKMMDDACTHLKVEKVSFFLHRQGHLECQFSDDIKGQSIPSNVGIVGRSFTERSVLNIPDVQLDKSFYSALDKQVGFCTRSMLSAPVIHEDGTVFGVIQALNKTDGSRSFSETDTQLMKSFCQRIAFLLSKKEVVRNNHQIQLSRQNIVSSSIDLHRGLSEGNVASALKELFSSLTDLHVILFKCLDDRLEILPATTTSAVGGNVSVQSSSVHFGTLPKALSDAITKGVIGETVIDTGAADSRALSLLLPPSSSKSAVFHVIVLPLPGNNDSKYVVVLVTEGRRDPCTVSEKKNLALLAEIAASALRNAREKSMLQATMERSRLYMYLMNSIISSMKVYVILLNQDGTLAGSNRPLEELFGELYVNACSAPSIDAEDIGRTYSLDSMQKNFLLWIDGIHKSLGEDIREVMETCTWKRVEEAVLLTPVYPDGVIIHYEVASMSDSDGAELTPKDGLISSFFEYANGSLKNNFSNPNCIEGLKTPSADREELKDSGAGRGTAYLAASDRTTMVTIHMANGASNSQKSSDMSIQTSQRPMIKCDSGFSFSPLMTSHDVVSTRDITFKQSSNDGDTVEEVEQPLDPDVASDFFGRVIESLQCIQSETILDNERVRESQALLSTVLQFTQDVSATNISSLQRELACKADTDSSNEPEVVGVMKAHPDFEELLLWDWNFDVMSLSNRSSLIPVITRMFLHLFNFSELEVNFGKFDKFLRKVQQTYHDNPFHNFFHATCVTHMLAMFINATDARDIIAPHLLFALLLSAVTHDVGHPGKTNGFLINSGSDLALLYNDESILESFHTAKTFSILRKPSTNIFCDMSPDKFKTIRKMIINCILATDMAKHYQVVAEMDAKLVKSQDTPDPFLIGRVLLHAADLSNPVRTFSIAKKWATMLSEEFNAQVDVEKSMGLPVQGWMITKSEKDLAKGEKGFITFNVKPLYTLLVTKYQSLSFLLEQLNTNLANYEEILLKSE